MISLSDYVEENRKAGYGVALCCPGGHVFTPYVEPDDWPGVMLSDLSLGDCARMVHGLWELRGWFVQPHGGVLESRPDYLTK